MASAKTRICTRCGKRKPLSQFTPRGRICAADRKATARAGARKSALMSRYGITPEEYAALLAHQGGKCAGCGETRRYNLHVDHDHKVEADLGETRPSVRGLLCKRCNKLLRDCRDKRWTLLNLFHYLTTPPAWEVIK